MYKYKYFTAKNLDELKAEYRRLVKIYHPDCGGTDEIMKQINNEHDRLFEELKAKHNAKADEYHQTTETAEEFREIIEALLNLDGLVVELCGSWLWISGETMKNKKALKAAGFRWSPNKKMWYWRHEEDGRRWHKGNRTIGEIRAKYGSQVFTAAGETSGYDRLSGATA